MIPPFYILSIRCTMATGLNAFWPPILRGWACKAGLFAYVSTRGPRRDIQQPNIARTVINLKSALRVRGQSIPLTSISPFPLRPDHHITSLRKQRVPLLPLPANMASTSTSKGKATPIRLRKSAQSEGPSSSYEYDQVQEDEHHADVYSSPVSRACPCFLAVC